MQKVILAGNVAYLNGAKATAFLGESELPFKDSTSPLVKSLGSGEISPWGPGNDFAQQIIALAEKSTEIRTMINDQVAFAYGRGIIVGQVTGFDKDGEEIFVPIQDPEIENFFERSQFYDYYLEALNDFYWFFNVFPEMILNKKRDKIVQLICNDASYCRYSKMNAQGRMDFLYVNANWPNASVDSPETTKIPVLDTYDYNRVEKLRNSKEYKVVYPISYPTPGKSFYQLAHWDGVRASGWLEVAAAIPQFKKALMKNQMTVKYHIKLPLSYWQSVYKDWEGKSEAEQIQLKSDKLEEMNNFLTDVNNTGKALMSEFGFDPNTKEKHPGLEIETIDDKLKDGAYIEDSKEASQHLMRAFGMDPTLIGAGPGKDMGAGSGSDKRVALNIYLSKIQPHRDKVLAPLNFIAEYNGWKKRLPGLKFKSREIRLETLDKNHSTKNNTIS